MPPKARAVKAGATTKREHAPEKRRRAAANRAAKECAHKYVVPGLVLLMLAIAIFFFYKYGMGKEMAGRLSKMAQRK